MAAVFQNTEDSFVILDWQEFINRIDGLPLNSTARSVGRHTLKDIVESDAIQVIILFAMLFALAGCSALEQPKSVSTVIGDDVLGGTEGHLPERFQLHKVPHNPRKQKGPDCSPDSLRMVLTYRGKKIINDQVIPRLLDEIGARRGRSGGTTFGQMQQIAVKHFDLPASIISNCDLDSLKAAIMNEWPPIVGYRSRGSGYRTIYHAVVAVGYDDKRRRMRVHDPNYVRVRDIRYDDLGGLSGDSKQTLACLLVLPEGSTEETLRQGLRRYVPAEVVRRLTIYSRFP